MTKEVLLKKLGQKISVLRKERSLSQTDLAYMCNWDRQVLHKIEHAKVNPSIYVLHRIATELNISLRDLLDIE